MTLTNALSQLQQAQKKLILQPPEHLDQVLQKIATALEEQAPTILTANQQDLARMYENDPKYDRLALDTSRIKGIADGLRQVAALPSPLGTIIEKRTLQNGLQVQRTRVSLGVIGMIYEARPNVTVDAFGIALKTQNAIALKGGSDAQSTNEALVKIIQDTLLALHLPKELLYLLPPDREQTQALMQAVGLVDVIIPRGSQNLIRFVREHSKVPVIETGAGIVHTYWDESGRLDYIKKIVFSAKTRRPSVCNALDTLIIHQDNLSHLATVLEPLLTAGVKIKADQNSFAVLEGLNSAQISRAENTDFGIEFLGLTLSIKTVEDFPAALSHIAKYSSKHSEAIVTEDAHRAKAFLQQVDAACVFWNTETGFSDGEQLELGAEIGISTQKLHARGPMALEAMTSYKWVIEGTGQTRI